VLTVVDRPACARPAGAPSRRRGRRGRRRRARRPRRRGSGQVRAKRDARRRLPLHRRSLTVDRDRADPIERDPADHGRPVQRRGALEHEPEPRACDAECEASLLIQLRLLDLEDQHGAQPDVLDADALGRRGLRGGHLRGDGELRVVLRGEVDQTHDAARQQRAVGESCALEHLAPGPGRCNRVGVALGLEMTRRERTRRARDEGYDQHHGSKRSESHAPHYSRGLSRAHAAPVSLL
jgi:hypothetical protein